ncbi:sulfite exporter TauE/SafE family protein [Pseudooceanicola sp. CBS1P-1]|uniref:Probable membrane transporter protein n=1 Tax=Pseudooceanicola albus TaxID=2692189 RepID=A0A6L7G3Y9_9RHOB|nr:MULTISPECIES: sulfite exporter TauE/SafE family protein [Pseudooceanicola]MBT9385316.1 sulfite exporter TauE/SafE family protein [Pseudooceanicola endophyticus]MXN18825.1 TSUP family transporter [Pseudooceanicola albus]
MFLIFVVILALTGAFAGVVSGLLGVGGGIFLVPVFLVLFRAFGVSEEVVMQMCVGTSTATIIATSLRSVVTHNGKGAVDWGVLKSWGPAMGLGAVLGVLAATAMHSDTLMAIFGIVAALMGVYMLAGAPRGRLAPSLPGPAVYAPLSGFIGFVCAMMGIGGGTFGVPALSAFGLPVQRAIATSAGFGAVISLPACVTYLLGSTGNAQTLPLTVGYVNLPTFALISLMTCLTVPFGVRLAHVLPAVRLRLIFAFFIILAALNMLRKAFF